MRRWAAGKKGATLKARPTPKMSSEAPATSPLSAHVVGAMARAVAQGVHAAAVRRGVCA